MDGAPQAALRRSGTGFPMRDAFMPATQSLVEVPNAHVANRIGPLLVLVFIQIEIDADQTIDCCEGLVIFIEDTHVDQILGEHMPHEWPARRLNRLN